MNIWLDEKNYQREHKLVGSRYSGEDNTQNTVFCLFEPDAEGMSADSFPAETSIYYGTRAGRRYPISAVTPPGSTKTISRAERIAHIKERRMADLGEDTPQDVLERILWEYDNGSDGPGLAKIMNDLAAKSSIKETPKDALPVLPVLPDVIQAINMGATDSRAVLVLVATPEASAPMVQNMRKLLFEDGIIGRMHVAEATPAEWAEIKKTGKVTGSELEAGMAFLRPDSFGQSAEVQTEIPVAASLEVTRAALTDSLKVFKETWSKLDREQLLAKGIAEGITWTEWDPTTKRIIELPSGTSRREHARKLGLGEEREKE